MEQNNFTQINNNYGGDQIIELTPMESVIKNLGMYIGSIDSKGTHHLFYEILSNSIDEYLAGYCNLIKISINKDGSLTVEDNGRGIPIFNSKGEYVIEKIFTTLHMGGKFDRKGYEYSGGKHGVGTTIINYVSDFLEITVKRDGFIYKLRYENGKLVEKTHKIGETKDTGTKITFLPSKKYLLDTKWDFNIINNIIQKQHYLTNNLKYELSFIDENGIEIKNTYLNNEGLLGFINNITDEEDIKKIGTSICMQDKIITYYNPISLVEEKMKLSFCCQYINQKKNIIYGYTNNINQSEGGYHVSGLKELICNSFKSVFKKLNKKLDKNIIDSDYTDGLIGIISINLSNPTLEGQTKNKLGDKYVSKIILDLQEELELIILKNENLINDVYKHVIKNFETRKAIQNLSDITVKKGKLGRITSISKLIDAESKDRSKCELFIVEGDSAGGLIMEVRNPQTQAIFKLKGKPINIINKGIKKTLDNEELNNLILALGTGIGKNFDIKKLRYGKIYILSDADPDGGHIQTLLLGFFKILTPQLFKEKVIFRIIPPLHGITMNKGGKKIYLKDDKELEKFREKNNPNLYLHTRFKGLGEMNPDSLYDTCIDPNKRIAELITDNNVEENLEFINNILGGSENGGTFKYNFLTTYVKEDENKILKKLSNKEIKNIAEETMYDFGMYSNQDRSVPSVEDGLKPVHRRILYSCYQMGLKSNLKTVKSAQIVGKVIGNFHPHGDSSVYGASVKLTQDFYLKFPLLLKTGNFGSVFGFNDYADYRYTEMKLSEFSEKILLDGLNDKKQIVSFSNNYDGTILEPNVLPAKIPNILLMPSFGIGVGLSANLPPHNINEVINACIGYLEDKEFKVYNYIKGPDFPMIDNEIISSEEELEKIYNSEGKGLKTIGIIKYRVKIHYNEKGNFLEIKSLPYNVEFGTIYERINELVKGIEKYTDPETKKDKYRNIPYNKSLKNEVKSLVNNSGTSGIKGVNPVNIKIFLNKGVNIDIVKQKLYKYTSLQTSFAIRPILINRKNRLKGYSFYDIIKEFNEFKKETLLNNFNIQKEDLIKKIRDAQLKIIYIDNIDFIVDTIKNNEKDSIIGEIFANKFGISVEEGIGFINYSLKILKKIEKDKVLENINLMNKELKIIIDHIENEKTLKKFMIKDYKNLLKSFGTERNTEIIGPQKEINIEDKIENIYEDKNVNLLFSKKDNYIYKIGGNDIKVKNKINDFLKKYGESYQININNRKKIYFIQNNKGYFLNVGDIKEEELQFIGLLNKKLDISLRIDYIYSEDDFEKEVFILLENNNIVRIKLGNLMKSNQGFKITNQNIKIIIPINDEIKENLIRITREGYVFKNNIKDIPLTKSVGNGIKISGETIFIGNYYNNIENISVLINNNIYNIEIGKLKIVNKNNKKSEIKINLNY